MKIFSKFCGLLRIYELYLSLVPKDRGKPKMYILSPNHDIVSYLTQTNNLGTTFYAIFMPSRSRSNCIFGLWVKSKILGSSHFALSESDLNALNFHEYNWFEEKWMKNGILHGLRTPREEIAFTARPKIQFQSQIFMYSRSIFCLPHRPNFSDIFDLCLHWVSVVRGCNCQ